MRFLDRLIWTNILKTWRNITISYQYKRCLSTTARDQSLDTYFNVETPHIDALIQANICFVDIGMFNKN